MSGVTARGLLRVHGQQSPISRLRSARMPILWRTLLSNKSSRDATHPAITMGNNAGIGPESIIKACEKLRSRIEAIDLRLLIIGSGWAMKKAATQLRAKPDFPEVRAADKEWPNLCFLKPDDERKSIKPGVL